MQPQQIGMDKGEVFTTRPPIRGPEPKLNYVSNLKSKFIAYGLEKEGEKKEKVTGESAFQYVSRMMDTEEIRINFNPMFVPHMNDLGVNNKRVFRGHLSTLKSGLCSNSVIKKPVEVTVEEGKVAMYAIEAGQKRVPIDPKLYRDVLTDIQFKNINEVIEEQKDAAQQKMFQKQPHKKLEQPKVPSQYVYQMESKNQKKEVSTLFLFAQDDKELESFKNVVLTQTDEGKTIAESRSRGGGGALTDIITLWKISLSEMFYNKLYTYVQAKMSEVKPKVPTSVSKKVLFKSIIRKMCNRINIQNMIKKEKADEKKKSEFLRKLVTNLVSMNRDNLEAQAQIRYLQWSQVIQQLVERDAQMNLENISMRIHKYYDLLAPWSQDKFGYYAIADFWICVSKEPVKEMTEAKVKEVLTKSVFRKKIQFVQVPERSNSLFASECRPIPSDQELDLAKHLKQYLMVCLTDRLTNRILGFGSRQITMSIREHLDISITDMSGATATTPRGILLFVREGLELSSQQIPAIEELIQPENYGMLRKYYAHQINDLALHHIQANSGLGKKFNDLRDYLRNTYKKNAVIAHFENTSHRDVKWRQFERLVADSTLQATISGTGDYDKIISNRAQFIHNYKRFLGSDPLVADPDILDAKETPGNQPAPAQTKDFGSYLFYSRYLWPGLRELQKVNDYYEETLMSAACEHHYLRIWKSIGKTVLIKNLILNILINGKKIPGTSTSSSLIKVLSDRYGNDFTLNPSINKDFSELVAKYSLDEAKAGLIQNILKAYLGLSEILYLETINPVCPVETVIRGFTLKLVGGLVNIVHRLVDLYDITSKNQSDEQQASTVIEDDVFLVLVSIAIVFLPEHFIEPIQTFNIDQKTLMTFEAYARLGINLVRFLKRKENGEYQFSMPLIPGSFKLAVTLPQLISLDSPEVFNKLTGLGFPFLSFSLDITDTLFSGYLNPDVMRKFWNLLFFESGHQISRRGQQLLLIGILTLIQNSKPQIMASRSAQEVVWHIRTSGLLDFKGREFIYSICHNRRKHLVKDDDNSDWIGAPVKNLLIGDNSVEQALLQIRMQLSEELASISSTNATFTRFLIDQNNTVKGPAETINVLHFINFLNSWIIEPPTTINPQEKSKPKKVLVHFPLNEFGNREAAGRQLASMPQIESITFAIINCEFGNLLPQSTQINLRSGFSSEDYMTKQTDSSWYGYFKFNSKCMNNPQEDWIEIVVMGRDQKSKQLTYNKKIYMDKIRLNLENYFTVQFDTFWLNFSLKATINPPKAAAIVRIEDLSIFDKDKIFRTIQKIEYLADHLEIKREFPYIQELLHSVIDNRENLKVVMSNAFSTSTRPLKFDKTFEEECLGKCLLGKLNPTMFEMIARLIIFSPLDNKHIFRLLFNLLTKLDLNRNNYCVKRTHVEFLIWYILRMGQIHIPYLEILTLVSQSMHEADSYFTSVVLSYQENRASKAHDLTDMFNEWLVSTRNRTGSSHILLGSKGYLNQLEKAIIYYQNELNTGWNFIPSLRNKLKISMVCQGHIRKLELVFNDKYKLIQEARDSFIVPETNHVLVLADSEENLSFDRFVSLMSQIQVLDSVFSKLSGFGGNKSEMDKWRKAQQEQSQSQVFNMTVTITHKMVDRSLDGYQEYVWVLGTTEMKAVDRNEVTVRLTPDKAKLTQLVEDRFQMFEQLKGPKQTPSLKDIKAVEPDVSIRTLIDISKEALINDLLNNIENKRKAFTECSLNLLGVDAENATLILQNQKLNPTYLDANLQDIAQLFSFPKHLTITCEYQKVGILPVFTRHARDIYRQEGVDTADNPLVPCQIVQRGERKSKVIFKGDTGSSS